ncbi:MAG: hypothetical protein H6810_04370 [Phycisphaeraceae bacterium]|nr:MAG: hypothetical protein H6810_04370 [Phycisphaeraceae bacterium]
MSRSIVRVVVSLCGLAAGSAFAAPQTVTWQNASGGLWSVATNWSPNMVPNNSGPSTFVAEISMAGPYTVSADLNVSLSGFTLTGAGASLHLTGVGRTLSTNGVNLFDGVMISGDGSTTVNAFGTTTMSHGGTVAGVSSLNFGGGVAFIDNDDWDLCDTDIGIHAGGSWSGTGGFNLDGLAPGTHSELVVESDGSLTLTGAGDRHVTATDSANLFINRGVINIQLASASNALNVTGATMINEAGGKIKVTTGKVITTVFGSGPLTRLAGGDWLVENEGTVDLVGRQISELEAAVELNGAGSSFASLDSVASVLAGGALAVKGGREFTTDAAAPQFDVQGSLEVGAGSTFTVSTLLTNVQGNALRGGKFTVGGDLLLGSGDINTLGSDVTLDGAGAIRSSATSTNLLTNLNQIETAGSLELKGGASFTTVGNLTLDGALKVRSGSVMQVMGDLSAFQNGTLGGANLEVGGDLIAANARVERVEGRLMVGLNGRVLFDDGSGPTDGLLSLQRIETGGTFGLTGGRTLDLTAMSNTVSIAGTMVLSSSGTEGPGNVGSSLAAAGIAQEAGSTLTIGIGGLGDFGHIDTDLVTFGTGTPPDLAGELHLVLLDTYTAALGDEFVIIKTTSPGAIFGMGFASLSVDGSIGAGLSFEQFVTLDEVGVRVVPAPGVGIALLGGLVATRRRRA